MLDQGKIDQLLQRARREVDEGLLPSCQIALGYQGEIVAEAVYGEATTASRYVIFSAMSTSPDWMSVHTVDATKGFVAEKIT